jgi:hypothetical protein
MAELLVKATVDNTSGRFNRGMPILVKPDAHPWGTLEALPTFVILKFPQISEARVAKYAAAWNATTRRRWQVRWSDLPLAARTKLQTEGFLVIKATDTYAGAFDYTWTQVKAFFRNLETGLDETEDL